MYLNVTLVVKFSNITVVYIYYGRWHQWIRFAKCCAESAQACSETFLCLRIFQLINYIQISDMSSIRRSLIFLKAKQETGRFLRIKYPRSESF